MAGGIKKSLLSWVNPIMGVPLGPNKIDDLRKGCKAGGDKKLYTQRIKSYTKIDNSLTS